MDTSNHADASEKRWRVVVNSVGDSGICVIKTLKRLSPLSETTLASLLYQAPSVLFKNLSREVADNINHLLLKAGLDSEVLSEYEDFSPGSSDYEIALAIKEMSCMDSVTQLVTEVLGGSVGNAREILCASPAVLMGKVSLNTVEALKRRFRPLGVELDVSRPDDALFDLFTEKFSSADRESVEQVVAEFHISVSEDNPDSRPRQLLVGGLSKTDAERVRDCMHSGIPILIMNRDFERFDVSLDRAPSTREMLGFLVSTGISEKIALKALEKTPIIIYHNISFAKMSEYLETITALGGYASGHLLALQTFSLALEGVGDPKMTLRILQTLAKLNRKQALKVVNSIRSVEGPLSSTRARWLKWELKQAGTEARMVLR